MSRGLWQRWGDDKTWLVLSGGARLPGGRISASRADILFGFKEALGFNLKEDLQEERRSLHFAGYSGRTGEYLLDCADALLACTRLSRDWIVSLSPSFCRACRDAGLEPVLVRKRLREKMAAWSDLRNALANLIADPRFVEEYEASAESAKTRPLSNKRRRKKEWTCAEEEEAYLLDICFHMLRGEVLHV